MPSLRKTETPASDAATPTLRERAKTLRQRAARPAKAAEAAKTVADALHPADRSDPVFAAINAHTLAYATYIGHPKLGEGNSGDNARSEAEDIAFEALLHTPLTTPAGRVAYAVAIIERETGYKASNINRPYERNDPLPVAYRNLRFGEHAPEVGGARPQVISVRTAPTPTLSAMVAEWRALGERLADSGATKLSDDLFDIEVVRHDNLTRSIHTFPAASLADLIAKLPLYRDELQEAVGDNGERETMDVSAWRGLVADLERLAGAPTAFAQSAAPDPVFEAIRDQEALLAAYKGMDGLAEDPGEAVWDAAAKAHEDAWHRMVTMRPLTIAGLLALIRSAAANTEEQRGADEFRAILRHVADSLTSLVGPNAFGRADGLPRARGLGSAGRAVPQTHPGSCEAARIGTAIDRLHADILRLDDDGAATPGHPQSIEYMAVNQTAEKLREALSYARAQSPEGVLVQIAVALFDLGGIYGGSSGTIQRTSHECAGRLLYSVSAAIARLHGIDRHGYGAGHYLSADLDRLSILDPVPTEA